MAGGSKAQAVGKMYEDLFDQSLERYKRFGQAVGETNYPPTRLLPGNRLVIMGQALPDRSITLAGGRACLVEIKSFSRKNSMIYPLTYKSREKINTTNLNQYNKLMEHRVIQALTYYCVAWHDNDDWLEWRLHDVSSLELLEDDRVHPALRFKRKEGVYVPTFFENQGLVPDWLASINVGLEAVYFTSGTAELVEGFLIGRFKGLAPRANSDYEKMKRAFELSEFCARYQDWIKDSFRFQRHRQIKLELYSPELLEFAAEQGW